MSGLIYAVIRIILDPSDYTIIGYLRAPMIRTILKFGDLLLYSTNAELFSIEFTRVKYQKVVPKFLLGLRPCYIYPISMVQTLPKSQGNV